MQSDIFIWGIRTNNLKNIDIRIVKDSINLILGPSGSGKSTLAYETISQIGQHEYLSMFADNVPESTYEVSSFKNMVPAIPIKQTNHNNNTRSSIGTYFGISRKVSMIYSALLEMDEDYFLLSKEENVCEYCHGLGTVSNLDINKIVDYNSTVEKIPFRCWNRYKDFFSAILTNFCNDNEIDPHKKFRELTDKEQDLLLNGTSEKKYSIKYKKTGRIASRTSRYYGVMLEHDMMPDCSVSKNYYSDVLCPKCQGMKYSVNHMAYKIDGVSIGEFLTMDFEHLLPVIEGMVYKVTDTQIKFALNKIYDFVEKAVELKLGHLFLNRSIPTLSGGELQRLRLVQVFNTQLSDLLIVLDEPLAGLSDNEKKVIKRNVVELAKNNTVLIVDHGKSFIDVAKSIICLGPVGGSQGGYIVDTNTYLAAQKEKIVFTAPECDKFLVISSKSEVYQYKGAKVTIAIDRMNLITGDSGIGKSTLLREYFPQVLENYVYINQKPLLGNKNSSVATSLDIASKIFCLFGIKYKKDKKFFSNLTGNDGCCNKCGGSGYVEYGSKTETQVHIECKECKGTGFNPILKDFKISGKSIFDIWNMTVDEALEYFLPMDKKISSILLAAKNVKLGHLKIGQATSSLSGGENIRIKMLKQIHSSAKIIGVDEPFKGLNNSERIAVGIFLDEMRKKGKTIIVIDHSEEIEQFFSKKITLKKIDNIIVD